VRDYRVHLLVKALNELDYAATIADGEGLSDCVEAIAAAESYINSVRKALRSTKPEGLVESQQS